MKVPWENVRSAIGAIDEVIVSGGVRGESVRDQLQAYVRNKLDDLEVSVVDPEAVYHGFVFAGLIVEMAKNAHRRGALSSDQLAAVAEVAQSLAAALIPYTPEDIRR